MIFTLATDECTLTALSSAVDAIAHCEGVDVEDGVWLFWDDRGDPLDAQFSVPNKRGSFTMVSGQYSLVSAAPSSRPQLMRALDEVRNFGSSAPFDSADGVRAYLERRRG